MLMNDLPTDQPITPVPGKRDFPKENNALQRLQNILSTTNQRNTPLSRKRDFPTNNNALERIQSILLTSEGKKNKVNSAQHTTIPPNDPLQNSMIDETTTLQTAHQHDFHTTLTEPTLIEPSLIEPDICDPGELDSALRCLTHPSNAYPHAWITGATIDFYLKMITQRHTASDVRYLSSQFYPILMQKERNSYCYGPAAKIWIERLGNIFRAATRDVKIFIPVHYEGNHWVLAFINFTNRTYGYYDSFQYRRDQITNTLERLLLDAHHHQDPNGAFEITQWTSLGGLHGPRQTDTVHCGVYMSAAAAHLLQHNDLSSSIFCAQLLPQLRQAMASELQQWHSTQTRSY
jgi:Ulp1 family protease